MGETAEVSSTADTSGPDTYRTNVTPTFLLLLLLCVTVAYVEASSIVNTYVVFVKHRTIWMRVLFVGLPVLVSLGPTIAGLIFAAVNVGTLITLTTEALTISRGRGELAEEVTFPWSGLKVRRYLFSALSVLELTSGHRRWRLYAMFCPRFRDLERGIEEHQSEGRAFLKRSIVQATNLLREGPDGAGEEDRPMDFSMKRISERHSKGFTLIELMVVLSIISVLISILLPNLRRSVERTDLTSCKENLRNVSIVLQQYSNDNNNVFPATLTSLVPTYLRAVPTCPAVGSDTYTPGYTTVSSPDQNFTVACNGTNHSDMALGANQPFYSLTSGLGP